MDDLSITCGPIWLKSFGGEEATAQEIPTEKYYPKSSA